MISPEYRRDKRSKEQMIIGINLEVSINNSYEPSGQMTGYSTVLTALNNFGGRQQLPILRFHFSLISPLSCDTFVMTYQIALTERLLHIFAIFCFFNKL